jgi:aldose 1-epimerase
MARAVHPLFVAVLAACLVAALGLSGSAADEAAGRKMVGIYELKKGDFSIKVTNWGATLMSVILPDSRGNDMICLLFLSRVAGSLLLYVHELEGL